MRMDAQFQTDHGNILGGLGFRRMIFAAKH
jgi:hypothetical protein